MSEKPTRAAWKALRTAKRKAHYKVQFGRTEINEKRRMRRHLRSHPADKVCAQQYEKRYAVNARDLGLTRRGTRRAALLYQHQE